MSAAEGVPVTRDELRPVLEKLETLANISADMTMGHVQPVATRLSDAWEGMRAACAAALASDAGTPEGEPEYRCRSCKCPIPDEVQRMGEFNFCSSLCESAATPEPAPLAESGAAAPEERDGELSRLLWRFCEQAQPLGRPDLIEIALDAIHTYVAQRERAAREAGRAEMGEVVGTATLYGGGKDGTSIGPGPDDELPELNDREIYRVSLVRRRGKEEG